MCVRVPELDAGLAVRRREDGSVRRKRQAPNLAPLRAERLPEQLPGRHVPERDRAVRTAGRERVAVRAQRKVERERRARRVARKRRAELRCARELEEHLAVLERRGERLAVAAECDGDHRFRHARRTRT